MPKKPFQGFNGTSVKVLILSHDCIYRTAGFRIPKLNEVYLAPHGEVKTWVAKNYSMDKPKLILRPFDPRVDGLVLTKEEKELS